MIEEKENLYNQVKEEIMNSSMGEMRKIFANYFCEVFETGSEMVDFVFPLSNRPNNPTKQPIVQRASLFFILSEEKKIKLQPIKEKRDAIFTEFKVGNSDSDSESYRIDEEEFKIVLHEEYDEGNSENRRRLVSVMDLAAFTKATDNFAAGSRNTYKKMQEISLSLNDIRKSDWIKKAQNVRDRRNKWSGHVTDHSLSLCKKEDIQEGLDEVVDVIETLYGNDSEISRKYKEKCKDWLKELDYEAIEIEALLKDDYTREGYTKEDVAKILKADSKYKCEDTNTYVLVDSADKARDWLDNYFQNVVGISVDELAKICETDEESVTKLLENEGISISNNVVKKYPKEFLIKYIGNHLSEEEKNRIETSVRMDNPEASEEEIDNEIIRKSLEHIAKLNYLKDYSGGVLNKDELNELVLTHNLLLDMSVILEPAGRTFLEEQIIPIIEGIRASGKPVYMTIDATSRYLLYKKVERYKELSKNYNQGLWEDEEDRSSMKKEIEALKKYKTAYIYMEDILRKEIQVLMYAGDVIPHLNREEAVEEFVSQNTNSRICLLTYGPIGELIRNITEYKYPLIVAVRINKKIISSADGLRTEAVIINNYLPLKSEVTEEIINRLARFENNKKIEEVIQKMPEKKNEDNDVDNDENNDENNDVDKNDNSNKKDEISKEENIKDTKPAFEPVDTLKPFSDEIIDALECKTGTTLTTEEGEKITLQDVLVEDDQQALGGEGIIYITDMEGQVAKIYHKNKLTKGRLEKLERMVSNKPNIDNICWPSHLLYDDNGNFVGFMMPKAGENAIAFQRSVINISKDTIQKQVLVNWNRLDLVQVAKAVADSMTELHKNNILMGDVNPGNFLADTKNSKTVYLVDCDSYQFDGYACPVGTLDYTHPGTADRIKVQGDLHFDSFLRTEQEEDYVLAILIFQILFLNEYPFNAKGKTIVEAKKDRIFPYISSKGKNVPDGDNWLIWNNTPTYICEAFQKVFRKWEHVSAKQWSDYLNMYIRDISTQNFTRELTPKKYHEYDPANPSYIDYTCEICKVEFNVPINSRTATLPHKLCRIHESAVYNILANRTSQEICDNCGKSFMATGTNTYLKKQFGDPNMCGECRQKLTSITCSSCGSKIIISKNSYKNHKKKKKNYICKKCQEKK